MSDKVVRLTAADLPEQARARRPASGASRGLPAVNPTDLNEFINRAPGKDVLPWETPGVRGDFRRALNVDISDPVLLKLEYLCQQDKKSKRYMTEMLLEAAIDVMLRQRGIVT